MPLHIVVLGCHQNTTIWASAFHQCVSILRPSFITGVGASKHCKIVVQTFYCGGSVEVCLNTTNGICKGIYNLNVCTYLKAIIFDGYCFFLFFETAKLSTHTCNYVVFDLAIFRAQVTCTVHVITKKC